MRLSELIGRDGISMDIKSSDSHIESVRYGVVTVNDYACVLRRGKHRMTIAYHQGEGILHDPVVLDVLGCVIQDVAGLESTFEDWASDYGYDSDSIKALKIYRAIQSQERNLKKFLGERFDEYLNCEWEE